MQNDRERKNKYFLSRSSRGRGVQRVARAGLGGLDGGARPGARDAAPRRVPGGGRRGPAFRFQEEDETEGETSICI